MAMEAERIAALGLELYEAMQRRRPVEPLTSRYPDLTIEEAYGIQLRMIRARTDAGARVIGKKIGVTSRVVQDMLNVDQPDFGHLLSDMQVTEGDPVSIGSLIAPRVEAEVAFVLSRDLVGPGVTAADALAATECMMPCFEIVDSRIKDWKIKIQDTVADNASCGLLMLSSARSSVRGRDLAAAEMLVEKSGDLVSRATGASVQGSPLQAVAWLANTLGSLGLSLNAGDVILSGSQSPLFPIVPGDAFTCSVTGLGRTSIRFVA